MFNNSTVVVKTRDYSQFPYKFLHENTRESIIKFDAGIIWVVIIRLLSYYFNNIKKIKIT